MADQPCSSVQQREAALRQHETEAAGERGRLERELADCRRQLDAYEAFEKSWDAFIAQAAEGTGLE